MPRPPSLRSELAAAKRRLRAATAPPAAPRPRRPRPPKNPARFASTADALGALRGFFAARGWKPHRFQEDTWQAYAAGESGLIHVATGAGKTYAAYLAPLAEVLAGCMEDESPGLQVIYVTPLRAVARDIEQALRDPVEFLGSDVRVEGRTGDTSSSLRQRQRQAMPEVLVTTPESLALLLTQPDPAAIFGRLRVVLLDEWHELLGSKRGSLLELTLGRLRTLAPGLRTWAMSATLGNLAEAAQAAVGVGVEARLIAAPMSRPVKVESLLPASVEALPWTGHTGLHLVPAVAAWLRRRPGASTLLFTTTRTQAERWFQALSAGLPEEQETLALHHGSLDRRERERVEAGLKSGSLRIVVATSTLDLGVDFGPVEQVLQLGSPRGVGRLLQRAGRASHRPGASAHLVLLPTHALELLDFDALRHALGRGEVEARVPLDAPLDVLLQHLITCAIGGGFDPDAMFAEVRRVYGFHTLSRDDFDAVLALGVDGGPALRAYPDFRKLRRDEQGRWRLDDERLAKLHRWGIGTIVGDSGVRVKFARGGGKGDLGVLDEAFVSRLKPGDRFHFAGRTLRLVRVRDLEAHVTLATGAATTVPRWSGARLPPSSLLARELRASWQRARDDRYESPDARLAAPLLALQASRSGLPGEDGVLVETFAARQAHHLFLYPLEGRAVHEGLGALLAWRLGQRAPTTLSLAVNDHGLELHGPDPIALTPALWSELLDPSSLDDDLRAALNLTELTRRQFREVARVAGLVPQGAPGRQRTVRQLQAGSGLLHDVLRRHDPGNPLVRQAEREVLDRQLDRRRLVDVLTRLRAAPPRIHALDRPSPLAFVLMVERLSAQLSTESLIDRVERMKKQWFG